MSTSGRGSSSLRDSLRKALRTPPIDAAPQPDPTWRDQWPVLAELGVTVFCVADEAGGFGREVAAAVVASRELGAALHGSPYVAVTAAAYALSRWLEPAIGTDATARILDGSEIPSLAFIDPGSTVVDDRDAMRVRGRARLVAGAADADAFLVLTPHDPTMVYVPAGDGCSAASDHPFDVTRSCADVTFEGASGVPVRCGADGRVQTERLHGLRSRQCSVASSGCSSARRSTPVSGWRSVVRSVASRPSSTAWSTTRCGYER